MPIASVGSLELCYESMGEGPAVLLVMGLGGQMVIWPEGFCRSLVDRGFRVIRFDNRDVGESTRLDDLGAPRLEPQMLRWLLGRSVDARYSLDDMADDAVGLLDALEISRAHVIGMSMGGMIAQLMALRHRGRVASLTSMMSSPGDKLSTLARPRALRALMRPLPRNAEEAERSSLLFFRDVGSRAFEHDEAGIRRRARRHFERGPSPRGFVRQMLAVLAADDRRPALRRLRIPSLVVHGSVDPLIPPRGGEQTARALVGCEHLAIEGMGHDLPPAVWPRILDAFERMASGADA